MGSSSYHEFEANITGSKEISKWMGGSKQQSKQEWTLNFNWSDKKVKTKNLLGCFEINSMFQTSLSTLFFSRLVTRLIITWFELWRVKLYRNELTGNKN